jgi:hypothetical protein
MKSNEYITENTSAIDHINDLFTSFVDGWEPLRGYGNTSTPLSNEFIEHMVEIPPNLLPQVPILDHVLRDAMEQGFYGRLIDFTVAYLKKYKESGLGVIVSYMTLCNPFTTTRWVFGTLERDKMIDGLMYSDYTWTELVKNEEFVAKWTQHISNYAAGVRDPMARIRIFMHLPDAYWEAVPDNMTYDLAALVNKVSLNEKIPLNVRQKLNARGKELFGRKVVGVGNVGWSDHSNET